MIKKNYQKPAMKVVKLQQLQMLCSSPGPATLRGHAKSGEESEDTWYDLE
ncbi:MAG: hypothetical protein IJV06_06300 [Bacteroidaceae bacterium]|nr:hypothetical protein [Bacteroidaceae bacterium]